jgi:hypothetical protein
VLAVSIDDTASHLAGAELVRQLGEKLYGPRIVRREAAMADRDDRRLRRRSFRGGVPHPAKRLPVKAQGYFNTWPDIVHQLREIKAGRSRSRCACWPSAAAITRLEQTSTGCSASRRPSASSSGRGRPRAVEADLLGVGLQPTAPQLAIGVIALASWR